MSEMDISEVLNFLPHRYPFMLIDRVTEIQQGERLVAIKNVSFNEPFFKGHFPGLPVMPGVLIVEALAQAAGILVYKTTGESPEGVIYYFAGVDNVRFKRVVKPGDQLRLEVTPLKLKRDFFKTQGVAFVGDEVVCEAELLCVKRPNDEDLLK